MWTIAKLTWQEMIYKKIFLITVIMSVLFIILYGTANHYFGKELFDQTNGALGGIEQQLMLQGLRAQFVTLGMYLIGTMTVLLTIMSSVGAISSDIETHLMDTIVARPISRWQIILGKWFGLNVLMVGYASLMFWGVIAVNQFVSKGLAYDWDALQLAKGYGLFMLLPILLTAVALFVSTRFTAVNGGVILIILYGMAFIGGFVEQIGTLSQLEKVQNIGIIASLIFPFDVLFRQMTETLFTDGGSPMSVMATAFGSGKSEPSPLMFGYILLYGFGALAFAIRRFTKRDL